MSLELNKICAFKIQHVHSSKPHLSCSISSGSCTTNFL